MKTIFLTIILSCTAHAQNKAEIVRQITKTAQVAGIDPDLAVAIATTESGLNPNVVGSLGELGVFQLRPEYHDTLAGNSNHNILVGVAYLLQLKTRFGHKYGSAWFVLYNYGPNKAPKRPKETAYYKRVMRELSNLKFQHFLAVR